MGPSEKPLNSLCDPSTGLYQETYFRDLLCLERKRTERSKKPFLLMKVHLPAELKQFDRNVVIPILSSTLFGISREVDIKGWYENDRIMAVIFTEVTTDDTSLFLEKLKKGLGALACLVDEGEISVTFHSFPELNDGTGCGCSPDRVLYPDLGKRDDANRAPHFLKRIIDVSGSLTAFILFSPFFIVIPILIKATSPGPVLFRQVRLGQFGKPFTFLKFRSMKTNCDPKIHQDYIKQYILEQKACTVEENGSGQQEVFKIKNDPRITPIGAFLRRTSLDELPQFINVLKGEMSLVGPRPPIPYELENYDIWHRRRVLEAKPGITGLWQVEGRSRTNFDDMVRLDLTYIMNWSNWQDIRILFKTVWVMVAGKGGY